MCLFMGIWRLVSVAGCLGYDVLVLYWVWGLNRASCFSCWLFRLWCAGRLFHLLLVMKLVSVAGCLGYDVLAWSFCTQWREFSVSVAGCLGYDVLGTCNKEKHPRNQVSVAGCLGYDVLAIVTLAIPPKLTSFSCWLFRLWCAGQVQVLRERYATVFQLLVV